MSSEGGGGHRVTDQNVIYFPNEPHTTVVDGFSQSVITCGKYTNDQNLFTKKTESYLEVEKYCSKGIKICLNFFLSI